ncbi:MAG: type II toxin-antitoxin system RelE/ParE family toxin [Acidobacteria bacterium]|nr:type II toxin-antitoxin system RelE/ParE family toxin [Acidobacteriota bacterium]
MYQVEFRPRAAQDFDNLDEVVASRVLKKLRWLAGNFDSIKPEHLAGPFSGLLKLRVDDYRVIYQADREKKVLTVRPLGHRREIYSQPP